MADGRRNSDSVTGEGSSVLGATFVQFGESKGLWECSPVSFCSLKMNSYSTCSALCCDSSTVFICVRDRG
ncbi:uncharacterized protein V6R79_003408 [Siganus canaliculatus]